MTDLRNNGSSDRGQPRVSLEVSFVHGDGFTSERCGMLSPNPAAMSYPRDLPVFTYCGCGRVLAVRVDDSWIGWTAFKSVGSKRLVKHIERYVSDITDD